MDNYVLPDTKGGPLDDKKRWLDEAKKKHASRTLADFVKGSKGLKSSILINSGKKTIPNNEERKEPAPP